MKHLKRVAILRKKWEDRAEEVEEVVEKYGECTETTYGDQLKEMKELVNDLKTLERYDDPKFLIEPFLEAVREEWKEVNYLQEPAITRFKGKYRFLSNFWPSPVTINGTEYPTVEHYYQSMKAIHPTVREKIRSARTPGMAKKMGRRAVLIPGWESRKVVVMRVGVLLKFLQNPELGQELLDTGSRVLMEGNDWGDTFWGVTLDERGESVTGENNLGKILIWVRKILREVHGSD